MEKKATDTQVPIVLLLGPPNCGKSSLFGRLTGKRQRIANYPGVTVERKEGRIHLGLRSCALIDLPGSYSLAASSPDEQIAVDALLGKNAPRPDAAICIIDAAHPRAGLALALQVAEFGIPQILVLNFSDEARDCGMEIDVQGLEQTLGIPVVETVGRSGAGLDVLLKSLEKARETKACISSTQMPAEVGACALALRKAIARRFKITLAPAEARRALLDSDSEILKRFSWGNGERLDLLNRLRKPIFEAGYHPQTIEPVIMNRRIERIVSSHIKKPEKHSPPFGMLDRILTHRVLGLGIFAVLMWLVFQSVYMWSIPFTNAIEAAIEWLRATVPLFLAGMPALQSLIADGVIGGAGSVLVFLPQILILFLCIGILEDSGYLARAAFLMDRLFAWCGLNGKSFVPLLSSYACAVPGILATRTIEQPHARLVTALVAPLISCSARLPVYVLIIGAAIEPPHGAFWAAAILFLCHVIGLGMALLIAWVVTRLILRAKAEFFIIELPRFRFPHIGNILWRVYERGIRFLISVGSLILAVSVLIWALAYFPRPGDVAEQARQEALTRISHETAIPAHEMERRSVDPNDPIHNEVATHINSALFAQSFLARLGHFLQPLFEPAGFDWKITVGILASLPAREAIVPTLGTIYGIAGGDETPGALRVHIREDRWSSGKRVGEPIFSLPASLALLVFFAFCMQCWSSVAVLIQEAGWRPGVGAFGAMTLLAWGGAVVTYRVVGLFFR